MDRTDLCLELETADAVLFGDLPTAEIPTTTGVDTIWFDLSFLYVGIPYKDPATTKNPQAQGLRGRLMTYHRGRRTNDMPLAVCDRYVIPSLNDGQIAGLSNGQTDLNALTKRFMHEHLVVRCVACPGDTARAIEREIRSVGLPRAGRPLLNPL